MYIKIDPPEKHICIVCGKEFCTSSLNRKTCSTECSHKVSATGVVKKCEICGKQFVDLSLNKGRKYCGKVCRNKGKYEYEKIRKQNEVTKPKKGKHTFTDTILELKENNISYRDYQMQKTLATIPKIDTNL